jgi:vacuolar protein-sorting-associated protein 4
MPTRMHPCRCLRRCRRADTPNTLNDGDYVKLGDLSEGCSGSDISVITREALMEPLRKCQAAKQFMPDSKGMLEPCDK